MATDPEDVDLEMSIGPQGAGDASNQQEEPSSPSAVPTVSEKVPTDRVDGKKARVPRRVLHFSDGTMEEYSTDEEDEPDKPPDTLTQLRAADTKSMGWMPWAWYWFRFAGYSTLSGVDSVGERLAYMLGITSPKYQYELDEYYEMKRKVSDALASRWRGSLAIWGCIG
ncbi:protein FAM177A1-like [Pollicipes pollicipes]|uniref:protein FAM177A1-like n=1 Tax=Pollicipes pollicipes TaxID=41117 RepID=UPI0018857E11|nr:protein FAM177A1-like [Pollicipes pollicipes]